MSATQNHAGTAKLLAHQPAYVPMGLGATLQSSAEDSPISDLVSVCPAVNVIINFYCLQAELWDAGCNKFVH